jgi:hypothetical protein
MGLYINVRFSLDECVFRIRNDETQFLVGRVVNIQRFLH